MKKPLPAETGNMRQNNHWNCGPAALNIAFARQGWQTHPIDELARVLGTTPQRGTSNRRMIAYVRRLWGVHEVVAPAGLHELRRWLKNGYSVILLYYDIYDRCGHFSVVTDIKDGRITLEDPWFGKDHSYSLNYFYTIWRDSEGNRRWALAFRKYSQKRK